MGQFQLPQNLRNMTVCAHLRLSWKQKNRLTEILSCRLGLARYQTLPSCINYAGSFRYPMCPTEIQVYIKPFAHKRSRSKGIRLVMTRWQLLGDGTSPFEKDWAHQLEEHCDPWPWPEGAPIAYIKKAFENHPGTNWGSILGRPRGVEANKESNKSDLDIPPSSSPYHG